MNCEICGFSDGKFYKTNIEGSVLVTCGSCSKGGKVIKELSNETIKKTYTLSSQGSVEEELKLDFSVILENAMKDADVSMEDLAARTKESQSTLKKVVSGKLIPTQELAKKLEKALSVSLFEKIYSGAGATPSQDSLKFEDVVEIENKQG